MDAATPHTFQPIPTPAIEVSNLVKNYGAFCAVNKISFSIHQGEMIALLGMNGAGKSSVISMLVGLENISGGEIKILGKQYPKQEYEIKKQIGVVPQELVNHGFFNIDEILRYYSGFYSIRDNSRWIEYLLEKLHLIPHRNKLVRSLSGGMKRRLLIAKALLHQPKILLLDEPTAGVDLELRAILWAFVRELNQQRKMTILLTTHYIEEAEALCERILVIHQGRLLLDGKTSEAIGNLTHRQLQLSGRWPEGWQATPRYTPIQKGSEIFYNLPVDMSLSRLLSEEKISLEWIDNIHIQEGNLEQALHNLIANSQASSFSE